MWERLSSRDGGMPIHHLNRGWKAAPTNQLKFFIEKFTSRQ